MKQKFNVTGMTCSACSSRVEKAVKNLSGVDNVSVNLLTNSMVVEFNKGITDENKIITEVKSAGYGADIAGNKKEAKVASNEPSDEIKSMKNRVIVSFIFLIPLLYLAMHHMLNETIGLPVPQFIKAAFHGNENAVIFAFAQFLLILPILYVNQKYYRVGFKTLWQRSPNMDTLIAIGSGAAVIYGIYAIFKIGYGLGHGETEMVSMTLMDLYFESAATILTLITLGKYLETKSKGKTSEAIKKLMDLSPKTANVERDGKEIEIAVEDVQIGDIVIVKPGQSIPVDGILAEGASSIDESAITGESIPVQKQIGDTVISATINKTGYFKFKATKVGDDTTIAKIIELVEEASSSKAPIAKLADKISGVFVPIVISIAVLAAIIWLLLGSTFEFALSIGIAVLVISCPCALGLATPVAIMVGTGKGAENGILIKSGEALETAHSIDTVVLDKTGTITEGKPEVTDILTNGISDTDLLQIAASLEKSSEHPLAEAILKKADNTNLKEISEFSAIPGKGISAKIGEKEYLAGNILLMRESGIEINQFEKNIDKLSGEGKTPLLFAENGVLIGIIAVADVIKPTSKAAISEFKSLGIEVVMLTGDNKRTAEAIRKQLGITKAIAEVLPQDKEREISALQKAGHKVAMVGDGINDAPALVRADVGIAIGAGTDVAIESADIILMKSDLSDAVTAVTLSKAVIRNIKQNLFWAFIYNCIGIPLAAGVFYGVLGWKLNPMFAAFAMSMSSVSVVLNALRLKMFKKKRINESKKESNIMSKKVEIKISGMSCNHCTGSVEKSLNSVEGVSAKVTLEDETAHISLSSDVSDEKLRKTIEDAGYDVVSINHI